MLPWSCDRVMTYTYTEQTYTAHLTYQLLRPSFKELKELALHSIIRLNHSHVNHQLCKTSLSTKRYRSMPCPKLFRSIWQHDQQYIYVITLQIFSFQLPSLFSRQQYQLF